MLRMHAMPACVLLIMAFLTCAAKAQGKTYTFGVLVVSSTEMDGQNKNIFADVAKAFSGSKGEKLILKWFSNDDDFSRQSIKANWICFTRPTTT